MDVAEQVFSIQRSYPLEDSSIKEQPRISGAQDPNASTIAAKPTLTPLVELLSPT